MTSAALMRGKLDLRIEDVPMPMTSSDDVLIRSYAVGICGSDVDMYRGVYSGLWKLPVVFGHEFAGKVAEIGRNVRGIQIGDKVTSEEIMWCGYCKPCKAGFPNYCENLEELGFTVPGAMAEYVKVNKRYVHKLPDNVSYEAGSVVEPASVAYNGIFVQGGGLFPGDFVAIFGAGPIGMLSAILSKAAGAEVAVFEMAHSRRRMAKDLGADYTFNPLDVDVVRQVKDLTNGYGANMAVECSANENVVSLAVESLRFKGKAVLIGMLEKPSTINGITLVRKGISLVGSLGHSGHDSFPHVINLVARGVIDPSKLITHRFTLKDAKTALVLASQRGDSMKITVSP